MSAAEKQRDVHVNAQLQENERLLTKVRLRRVRREATIRQADRKFRHGLATIRRGTLRVIHPS